MGQSAHLEKSHSDLPLLWFQNLVPPNKALVSILWSTPQSKISLPALKIQPEDLMLAATRGLTPPKVLIPPFISSFAKDFFTKFLKLFIKMMQAQV